MSESEMLMLMALNTEAYNYVRGEQFDIFSAEVL